MSSLTFVQYATLKQVLNHHSDTLIASVMMQVSCVLAISIFASISSIKYFPFQDHYISIKGSYRTCLACHLL